MLRKLLISTVLSISMFLHAFAQDVTVSGTVKDETGEGLPGVSVIIKGTASGTITDVNGKFQINVAQGKTLVFQAVGLISQEIVVGSSTTIDMTLLPDTRQLNEVVVNALGFETDRDKSAASSTTVGEINSPDLVKLLF